MARGRKKKVETLSEDFSKEVQELRESLFIEPEIKWDVPIDQFIEYFDPVLSYELTKYRPIDEERGLDFDPAWFTEARDTKLATGKYCAFPPRTKAYTDFWQREYDRCNNGMEAHGYRITGDHYFFLNYYQLPESQVEKTGQGRGKIYPAFLSKQYEYFHYIEICERTKHDVLAVKSRAVGFSEIAASLGVGLYSTRKNAHSVQTAFALPHLEDVLGKAWYQLDNLNADIEGGMRHVMQKYNSDIYKKASKVNKQREELPNSWGSDIEGRVIDKPRKLRGDRIDRLFFEEAGSNPVLKKTYIQGNALVEVMGNKIGTRFVWGTGGDGQYMGDLSDMFYNPQGFNVLPYRHNYTRNGEYILSGFFVPSFTFVTAPGYIDHRGVTNTKKAKEFREKKREALLYDPKAYLIECAEFCFTPDEAFALEGDNQFNKVLLADQMAQILMGRGPTEEIGTLDYKFKEGKVTDDNIEGVKFTPKLDGKVHILERPKEDDSKKVPVNLYVGGIDGIDLGGEDTSEFTKDASEFCVIILRRMYGTHPPPVVAYYKDRPPKIKEAHMMCLKLLQYYNAQACLESTRISILQFFREKKCENKYLMRRPRSCQSDIQHGKSRQFGAPATETVIRHQLDLISDYIDEYSEEIWFKELLHELSTYSYENKRKFDMVAALGMAMLANEELMFVQPKMENDKRDQFRPFGYWVDERGIKHKGVIPQANDFQIQGTFTNQSYIVDSYGYERLRISSSQVDRGYI